jgi:ketosteroid isomerase-like protein
VNRILLSLALVVCAATLAAAQTDKPAAHANGSAEQAVLQTVYDWLAAEAQPDRAALTRIIADDFRGLGIDGKLISKRMLVPPEGAQAGGIRMKTGDWEARVFGDAAVVTGRGLPAEQDTSERRFTLVFVHRQDRWQMVAAHISSVQAQ